MIYFICVAKIKIFCIHSMTYKLDKMQDRQVAQLKGLYSTLGAGKAQSLQQLTMGWMTWWSEFGF